jgi:poly(ADP-ribose) glycohydrolase
MDIFRLAPKGNITFIRKVLQEKIDWNACNTPLRGVQVHAEGIIEDADGALHADFANQFLGGGALEGGCVQEEIMFTVQNELCAGMLFCTSMNKTEAILMIGSEQYSDYKGYGGKFEYVGNFKCRKERDEQRRKKNYIVAIDALDFRMQDSSYQFKPVAKKRELNKAYIGFLPTAEEKERAAETGEIAAIATGNWGGGAFRGDKPLKAVRYSLTFEFVSQTEKNSL